jgi:hypothetical protein
MGLFRLTADRESLKMRSMPTRVNGAVLFNEYEAARYIGMSVSWLRSARMTKPAASGPPFLKYGGARQSRVHYRRADLDAWMQSRLRRPAAKTGTR